MLHQKRIPPSRYIIHTFLLILDYSSNLAILEISKLISIIFFFFVEIDFIRNFPNDFRKQSRN